MRTSKKRMNEIDKLFTDVFGKGNMVYAAGEWDASKHAYIRRDGKLTRYESNTEAYFAAIDMMMKATEEF